MRWNISRSDGGAGNRTADVACALEVVEPFGYGVTPDFQRCSALAVIGSRTVALVWSPTWLGAEARRRGSSSHPLLVSTMDLAEWSARRAHRLELLLTLGCERPIVELTEFRFPEVRRLLGMELRRLVPQHGWTELTGRRHDVAPLLHYAPGPAGEVTWWLADAEEASESARARPLFWLNPQTRIPVRSGPEAFGSASFDGWPVSWRRRFAIEQGLPSDAPVNTLAGLPAALQRGAVMSEWTCRALSRRFAAWPLLQRRLAAMPHPVTVAGVRDEDVARWWPRWSTDAPQGDRFND